MARTKLKEIDDSKLIEINEAISHFYEQYSITNRKKISFINYMRSKIKSKVLFRYFLSEFNKRQYGYKWFWNKNLKKWSTRAKKGFVKSTNNKYEPINAEPIIKRKIERTEEEEATRAKRLEKKKEDKRLRKLIYKDTKKRKLQESEKDVEKLRNAAFRPQNAISSHVSVWTVKKR